MAKEPNLGLPKRHSVVMGALRDEIPHSRAVLRSNLSRRHSLLAVDPAALDRLMNDATVARDDHDDHDKEEEDVTASASSGAVVAVLVCAVVAGGVGTNVAFESLNNADPGT